MSALVLCLCKRSGCLALVIEFLQFLPYTLITVRKMILQMLSYILSCLSLCSLYPLIHRILNFYDVQFIFYFLCFGIITKKSFLILWHKAICLSYFSVTVIRHHDRGNRRSALGSSLLKVRVHDGGAGVASGRQLEWHLRAHTLQAGDREDSLKMVYTC